MKYEIVRKSLIVMVLPAVIAVVVFKVFVRGALLTLLNSRYEARIVCREAKQVWLDR